MFSQLATSDSLSKASTMVFRIGSDAHLYDDPADVSIIPLLDSRFDSDQCEGLKRLLALIAQGVDVSSYFPQVVKNVASQSVEVKKLVYLYLLHYADKRPNEALLSINYFQKDLGDPNPLVRAWALRTMAGIRLHVIAPLVLMSVGKCARDPSVYVRKCAANALPKLHDLRLEEHKASIEEIVGMLLNDNSPGVVGAAAAAFASVCPTNLSLIGRNYKRLCETVPDVEEWGQILLIEILLRYAIAKHGLVEESIMLSSHYFGKHSTEKEDLDSHLVTERTWDDIDGEMHSEIAGLVSRSYLEGPDKYLSKLGSVSQDSGLGSSHFTSAKSNDDVKILLQCTLPLLWSHNSAVVLAAAGVHWIMAPREDIKKIVKPLLFLLRSSSSSKYVVLCNIQVFAKAMPSLFVPYFEDFFISNSDSYQIKALKLEILSAIATKSSISSIFLEFQDYVRDPDRKFAADTVAATGLCARRLSGVADTCLDGLLALALYDASPMDDEMVLVQAINSIKEIIMQDPSRHEKVIIWLVRSLVSVQAPAARAVIIWMVGEFSIIGDLISKMLPALFKYLARCFTLEAVETKLQVLNACFKALLHGKHNDQAIIGVTVEYIFELAICDLNYDVRDRARIFKRLLSRSLGSDNLEEVKNLSELDVLKHIFSKSKSAKPEISLSSRPFQYRFYLPGTLSQIVLHSAPGYEPLPEPCSLIGEDSDFLSDDSDTASGSMDDNNASDYSSQNSVTGSSGSSGSYVTEPTSDATNNSGPLIHLSDANPIPSNQTDAAEENNASSSNAFGELMSKTALESWLDENPAMSEIPSAVGHARRSLARISIKDISSLVKSKSYKLLDPANGNGLSVDYVFLSETSSLSPLLVCLQVSFRNCSSEPMSDILLVEEETKSPDSFDQLTSGSDSSLVSHNELPTLVPMEEIAMLEPGQNKNIVLQVRFHHHLMPLKLVLRCNARKHAVKLRPDIGYFIKPLPMDFEAFSRKESQLPGMFEYIRRCTFTDHIGKVHENDENVLMKDKILKICEQLALKMLSNVNLFLVSVDMPVASKLDDLSGLCLRLTGEILSNSLPCLVTLTVEGTCYEPLAVLVKINCEETVFGLNLLNRIVNFMAEPTP